MLRLQQYEKLLKVLLNEAGFEASMDGSRQLYVVRDHDTDLKTLGILVHAFLGSVLTGSEALEESTDLIAVDPNHISFKTRFSIVMESDRRASVAANLEELVKVRNELVHHFIDKFDVWSIDGCGSACDWLNETFILIDTRFHELRDWAELLDRARKDVSKFHSSSVFDDFLNGINPDGTVSWDRCGIVRVLIEAAEQFGNQDWTPLDKATQWIASKYPEQRPERYLCKSWRQVVHESKALKMEYVSDAAGKRIGGYRRLQVNLGG